MDVVDFDMEPVGNPQSQTGSENGAVCRQRGLLNLHTPPLKQLPLRAALHSASLAASLSLGNGVSAGVNRMSARTSCIRFVQMYK